MNRMVALVIVLMMPLTLSCAKKIKVGPEGARVIAKNAYIYGFPIVENYKMMYAYAVYKDSGHFRAPFNTLAVVANWIALRPTQTQAQPGPADGRRKADARAV